MHQQEFIKLCIEQGYPSLVVSKFVKAIELAQKSLKTKKRLAGDTFFEHNLRVGAILVRHRSAPEIVISGLLHDTLNDEISEEIINIFGEETLHLIKSVDEIRAVKSKNRQLDAETVRKIILTTLDDVRVVLVKLANKLDNLRTIHVFHPSEQKRMAQDVLDIYAPLAYRLGMDKLKTKLEDLAFKIINPKKHGEIINYLKELSPARERHVDDSIKAIKEIASDKVDLISIKGRSKGIYSIYKKMTDRGVKIDQQFDLLGARIVVPEIKDCYTILGLLHEKYDPVDGRLKDYISKPKPNFYRSIHTGVRLPSGKIMEVQIRTPEMQEFAEEGIAAHWRYKGVKSEEYFEKKISWLRNLMAVQNDNKEFMEIAKIDIFGDKIQCYTPKGDVKELPVGGTILDFAYLIHEEIGNKTVGGRVNGRFSPLRRKLEKGDVVEIITNKSQRPRRSWIKIVRSSRARQKIRKSLREHEVGIAPFYYRLLKPIVKEDVGILAESESFPNALCTLAKCCRAIPGDKIVGILTKRRVLSVHREDCRAANKEEDRWVSVNWKENFGQKIKFNVEASERSGLLADLLHTIATAGFEVKEAKAKLIDVGNVGCSFLVVPKTLDELKSLISRVQKVNSIRKIYFE
jgi:GTP diphosphokinase / guanosine-3',5'-bis(diphosphate) 3'-diphosphatase